MAKKNIVRDLLVKAQNIFPSDLYIVYNRYLIAGPKSDDVNRGYYLCILESDITEVYRELFPDNPIVFIPSIKEAKDDMSKVEIIRDEEKIKKIQTKLDTNLNQFHKELEWGVFVFSDEEIETLFTNVESLELFKNDKEKSGLIVSKSLFPLVNAKTVNTLTYAYDEYKEDDKLRQLLIRYDFLPYFQFYMRYLYLPILEEK